MCCRQGLETAHISQLCNMMGECKDALDQHECACKAKKQQHGPPRVWCRTCRSKPPLLLSVEELLPPAPEEMTPSSGTSSCISCSMASTGRQAVWLRGALQNAKQSTKSAHSVPAAGLVLGKSVTQGPAQAGKPRHKQECRARATKRMGALEREVLVTVPPCHLSSYLS